MNKTWTLIALFLLLPWANCLATDSEKEASEQGKSTAKKNLDETKDVFLSDGPASAVKAELNGILKLTLSENKLKFDRKSWDGSRENPDNNPQLKTMLDKIKGRPNEAVLRKTYFARYSKSGIQGRFNSFALKTGRRSTSTSRGTNTFTSKFSGGTVEGSISTSENDVHFRFTEKSKPERSVDVTESASGNIRVLLTADDTILILNQSKTGKIRLIFTDDAQSQIAAADSFRELVKQNDEFAVNALNQIRHMGFKLPLLPEDYSVRQKVVARIRFESELSDKVANELIEDLNSPKFIIRESASRKIDDNFLIMKDLIDKTLEDEGNVEYETRSRLHKIIRDNKVLPEADVLINTMNLLSDQMYLLELAVATKSADVDFVWQRLKKETGQNFGDDYEEWKSWIVQNAEKASANEESTDGEEPPPDDNTDDKSIEKLDRAK